MRGRIRAFALFIVLLHSGCIWAATGDTAQQDIAREFSGAPTTNNNGANPIAAPTDCNAALQQEEAAGQIPANESCYCQVGATTPTCVQNAASTCQAILPAEESRLGPNAKYYDCTCPSGARTPSCPSYYSLCQDNLQYYQNASNQCSCSNPSTTAVPTCVSDYSLCENNAAQYENSNTTCSCSQTSTAPTCCTSTTTEEPTTVTNQVQGISLGYIGSGVSYYCANPSRQIENTGQGPACPGSSGITTCYQGICRTWNSGSSMYGGAFSGGGTYNSYGSYWDWGQCDGPNPAGFCANGGWFTINFGPSGFTGPAVILYSPSYSEQTTVYNPVTTQSCVTEP